MRKLLSTASCVLAFAALSTTATAANWNEKNPVETNELTALAKECAVEIGGYNAEAFEGEMKIITNTPFTVESCSPDRAQCSVYIINENGSGSVMDSYGIAKTTINNEKMGIQSISDFIVTQDTTKNISKKQADDVWTSASRAQSHNSDLNFCIVKNRLLKIMDKRYGPGS